MDILQVAGLAILGVFVALLLKETKASYSTLIGIAMALILCGYMLTSLIEVIDILRSVWSVITNNEYFLSILLQVVGITYVCELTTSICKEAGYATLAGQVTMAGKIAVLLVGFPVFQRLLDFILELSS